MADTTPPPAPAPTPDPEPTAPAERSPFNQEQLAEIKTAGELLAAANDAAHNASLFKQGITPEWLAAFAAKLGTAKSFTTRVIEAREDVDEDTAEVKDTRSALALLIKDVQKAAKQKHRMLDTDDDPTTNFSTDGYLISKRLHPSAPGFLANARALLAKARADDLPGLGADELTAIEHAISAHEQALAARPGGREGASRATVERNDLVAQLVSRRIALQHAADRAYPPGNPLTSPSRTRFHLDPDRSFSG